MRTSPPSGRMSPLVVFNSTLLPPPDRPTMATISPLAMERSMPCRTGRSKLFRMFTYSIIGSPQQERRKERVHRQNGDGHEHDRGVGRATHAFGAAAREKPHVNGDHRDREAERDAFEDRIEKV